MEGEEGSITPRNNIPAGMQQLAKCKTFTHRFPSIPTCISSCLRTPLFMSFQKIWLEERSVLFPLSGGNHWITERN